jgi:hypothetical protein
MIKKNEVIVLVLLAMLILVVNYSNKVTGMVTGVSSNPTTLTVSQPFSIECGQPCWASKKMLGAKDYKGNCVELEEYVANQYCCHDDDCEWKCEEGTCVEKLPEYIPLRDTADVKVQFAPDKINILFVPDKSYVGKEKEFQNTAKQYFTDFEEILKTKHDIDTTDKFNLLYMKETADCHEDSTSAGGFSCERKDVEKNPFYEKIDMVAILIAPGTSYGTGNRPHAWERVLVADSAKTFVHEIGHLFGLADEYGRDGLYFQIKDFPNVWSSEQGCKAKEGWVTETETPDWDCEEFSHKGSEWYVIKDNLNIMLDVDNGMDYGYGKYRIDYVLKNLDRKDEILDEVRKALTTGVAQANQWRCLFTTRKGTYGYSRGKSGTSISMVCTDGCQVCMGETVKGTKMITEQMYDAWQKLGWCQKASGSSPTGEACIRNCQCDSKVCDTSKLDENGYGKCKMSCLNIVEEVKKHIGKPFSKKGWPNRWGNYQWDPDPDEFDGSGLTWWVYKKHGIDIPTRAILQYEAFKNNGGTDNSKWKLGDLCILKNMESTTWHVGIYDGQGNVIHSSETFNGISRQRVEDFATYADHHEFMGCFHITDCV